jgi:ABC-type lipoprotein export system ATPase subunit/GNAT superfamily N-acetyltransferase
MSEIVLKHQIKNDRYTEYIYNAFDIQNKDESVVKIANNIRLDFDWNIGVIYGGSGTGKSTLLKQFGEIKQPIFDNSKSLISNFDFMEPEEATSVLSAMGLSSVPAWLRPHCVLSNGEQYRASMAYIVAKASNEEIILIDEFTSVVDRDVAKAMSNSLQKYIRRTNKKIVLASCHFDIMEWLQPDWVYSPNKERVERPDYLRQRKPKIELEIFRCRYETWRIFKQHHYLSEDLNKAAKSFCITWNDKPIAFIAILPMPSGTVQNAYRVSRLVVLPDYQGLGVGIKILNYFGLMYKNLGLSLYIKTSNPSLFNGMSRNQNNWKLISENNNVDQIKMNNEKLIQSGKDNGIKLVKESITKSYKFIGEFEYIDTSIVTFNADSYKYYSQHQISLF